MSASTKHTPNSLITTFKLSLPQTLLKYPIYPYSMLNRESLDLLLEYKDMGDMLSLGLHRQAHNPDITPQEHQEFLCTYILLICEAEGL